MLSGHTGVNPHFCSSPPIKQNSEHVLLCPARNLNELADQHVYDWIDTLYDMGILWKLSRFFSIVNETNFCFHFSCERAAILLKSPISIDFPTYPHILSNFHTELRQFSCLTFTVGFGALQRPCFRFFVRASAEWAAGFRKRVLRDVNTEKTTTCELTPEYNALTSTAELIVCGRVKTKVLVHDVCELLWT